MAGTERTTVITAQPGSTVNVYYDGLPQAKGQVHDHFEEGERLQDADQHDAAIREFEKAFAAAENDRQRCALHLLIGNSFLLTSRLAEAEGRYREALDAAQRAEDREGRAVALGNVGGVHYIRGELDKAEEHYKKALAIDEEIGNRLGQANQLRNLGVLQAQRGNAPDALRYLHDARRIFAEAGASADVDKTDRLIERLEGASPPKPRQNRGSEKRPPKP
jgi:tetratricopeptide (TPR) repeat protein